jgi:putative spermidine/putrescine transport system permease protein
MAPRGVLAVFALPSVVVGLLFFVLPITVVLAEAFGEAGAAFSRLAGDPVFWRGLKGSLLLGSVAPFAAIVVGTPVAMHLARMAPRRRTVLLFLISLPLTFSGLIVAYGFILVFGRAGFVTLLLAEFGVDPAVFGRIIYSPAGLGIAYAYYLIPRVVMVVLPVILNFDDAEIAAARSLGAGALRAYRDILIPQIAPSLVAAYCLTAAVAIGAYGTALALVGTQVNILPLVLYSKLSETGSDFPAVAALSVVLMAICCVAITGVELIGGRTNALGRKGST